MDEQKNLSSLFAHYKGIILDLDGTLVDLGVDWQNVKLSLREYCSANIQKEVSFTPLDAALNDLRKTYGDSFYKELLDIIGKYELEEKNYQINYPLLEAVNSLADKKIAIYSMNLRVTIDSFLKKHMTIIPDIIISKENCIEPKPTGKDLLKIVNKWGFTNQEVLFVGDTEQDASSGTRAHIKTFIIKR